MRMLPKVLVPVVAGSAVGVTTLLAVALAAAPPPAVAMGKKIAAAQAAVVLSMEEATPAGVDDQGAYYLLAGNVAERWADTRYAFGGPYGDKPKLDKLSVVAAADGKSAWLSFGVNVRVYQESDAKGWPAYLRVTELVGDTGNGGGWRVVAAAADAGMADKDAHELGRTSYLSGLTGNKTPPEVTATKADDIAPALMPVVDALRAGTLADLIADRKDFVTFGSATKERVASGKSFKKALAGWGAAMKVVGPVKAGLAPSGTTGYVAASLLVGKEKKQKDGSVMKYAIPFHLFVVVDQTGGAWKVVAAHLSVAP